VSAAGELSILEAAQAQAGLSSWDLWLRYFALGGSASPGAVEGHTRDGGVLDDGQHDILVHALNERFADMDLGRPLAYALQLQL
jgi:hypothetical protein